MGLIKELVGSAINSLTGNLADQWKEVISCDSLPNTVLIRKGQYKLSGRSVNINGEPNIISNGSRIIVNEGQCAIITDNGKVVDITLEPGGFIWNNSSEPSVFSGEGTFGTKMKSLLKESLDRFGYGGQPSKEQKVYYVNIKEITGNKFGTPSPIPYRIVDKNVGFDLDLSLRCNGLYSFKIIDPIKFYVNISGNIANELNISEIEEQLKSEFINGLMPAFAELGKDGIRPSELSAKLLEVADAMDKALSTKWGDLRGLDVISVAFNAIRLTEEDEKRLKDVQQMGSNAGQQSRLIDVMEKAANNQNGAMAGFMGMNMANMGMNNMFGGMAQSNNQQNQQNQGSNIKTIKCIKCGKIVEDAKFCKHCGALLKTNWTCECGTENDGNFCTNCGKENPINIDNGDKE